MVCVKQGDFNQRASNNCCTHDMNHSHRVYIPRIDNLCIPSWWGRKKLHTYKSSRIFAEVKVNI